MKLHRLLALVVLSAAPLAWAVTAAFAQAVTAVPIYVGNNQGQVTDLGNGPLELRVVQGSANIFTAQGSGIGSTSGSSTALTLTATPAIKPCVGCQISGAGITPGTTVSAYNGTTGVTLSAAMTVAASTPLAWGAACPTSPVSPSLPVQANVGNDLPLYTGARICATGQYAAGAALLTFPIGAH